MAKSKRSKKEVVVTVKPRCDRCEGTEHIVIRTILRPFHGRDPAGHPFTAVRWQFTECVNCGERGRLKYYLFEGHEDWRQTFVLGE